MRLAYYAGASTAAAAACLLKAFHQRPNFYSATVYLSQSNACLLILTNLLLVMACSFMFALQRLLYGPLRPIEIEQLSEKAWYAVLDTLLAMPSFREDVGGWLLAMFTLLLAGKVWGWIGEGRVDVLEQQPPANPLLFHIRLGVSLGVSVLFDAFMLYYCIDTVMADPRPGMMVIFTFEFAIQLIFSTFTILRFGLAVHAGRVEKAQTKKAIEDRKAEIRAERAAAQHNETGDGAAVAPAAEEPIEVDENEIDVPGWEDKRRWLFALEVITDFLKLVIYIVFFTVSITFNGLPMHIMRDVYMTFASFSKRVRDYVAYRKATSDMNARYPDATTEEIRGDACIVCREVMVAWNPTPEAQQQGQQPAATPPPPRRRDEGLRAKKLPCGHILHLRCLKSWLERQQVCPTCRRPVVGPAANARQTGAGAAGQNGAGAQARQPRQGRARILNFGPVRIGFLNGPGDQIANIVRQMQNQNQNQNQQNAGAPEAGAHEGPNHLGLQVPYADGAQQGALGNGSRSTVPTSVQILQLEQRILQDAQALRLEQQQLQVLQAMDAELNRLRAWQLHQQAAAAGRTTAAPPPAPPQHPIVPFMPHHQHLTLQQPHFGLPPQQLTQALHGSPDQQMGSGHANLPQGMVLPEGWTIMPLQRADGLQGSAVVQAPDEMPQPTPTRAAPAAPTEMNGDSATSQHPTTNGLAGPTDDRGSPLFVPADRPSTNGAAVTTASANGGSTNNAPTSTAAQPSVVTASNPAPTASSDRPINADELRRCGAPWLPNGWSFADDQPHLRTHAEPAATNGENESSSRANGSTEALNSTMSRAEATAESAGQQEASQSYEGKGKAKVARVEDAEDEGS